MRKQHLLDDSIFQQMVYNRIISIAKAETEGQKKANLKALTSVISGRFRLKNKDVLKMLFSIQKKKRLKIGTIKRQTIYFP